jgi:hypothetical protein
MKTKYRKTVMQVALDGTDKVKSILLSGQTRQQNQTNL